MSARAASDDRALTLAMGYLNAAERTVEEVRRHLLRRGVEASAAEAALATLTEQGYLDDARYARIFIEDKRTLAQWGTDRIRRGLLTHGIERELAEQSLAAQHAPEDEHARALELLRQRFPAPPQDPGGRRRALGVLIRKGFDSELALDTLADYARGSGLE